MNYINKLEEDNRAKIRKILDAKRYINDISVSLMSSKFNGVDLDGARKDWIAIKDVQDYLMELRNLLSE